MVRTPDANVSGTDHGGAFRTLGSIGNYREVTMTEPAPVNTTQLRLSRTPMDMAKAVLILLVPIAILFALYVFFFGGNNVIPIDPSGTYSTATSSANFTVAQPSGLSDKWKPVSSAYADDLLRVGYIAPNGDGIQLIESSHPANALLDSEVSKSARTGTAVSIGDTTWGQLNVPDRATNALVSTVGNRTIIIRGDTDFKTLQEFASALR
jgi:hypothetical protein